MFDFIKLEYLCENFQKLAKEHSDAKIRNRGDCVFPANTGKNKSNKDHYPINNINQARNALARASQHDKVPDWYDGSLDSLVKTVKRKVKEKYPSIETTDKSSNPGKD